MYKIILLHIYIYIYIHIYVCVCVCRCDIYIYIYIYIIIHIYICVCVCVCVCVCKRESLIVLMWYIYTYTHKCLCLVLTYICFVDFRIFPSTINIVVIINYSLSVFHISLSWWSFTGVWVTASLLKSPGLFSVFWLFTIMLSFGWSSPIRQLPSPPVPLVIL